MFVIYSVDKDKTTSCLVVVTPEPVFYEIHYLCTCTILRALKINIHTKATDKNTRICTPLFTEGNTVIEFSSRMIL